MSKQVPSPPAPESSAPYGTETRRPRWIPVLWIVLLALWLVFIASLVVRDLLRS